MGSGTFFVILLSLLSYQPIHAPDPERKPSQTKEEKAYAAYEPFKHFSDVEYELNVNIHLAPLNEHYWGTVFLTMKCLKKSNKLYLDQYGITINENTIQAWECMEGNKDREIIIKSGMNINEEYGGYRIKLEEYMKVDVTYKIRLEFSKNIKSQNHGFIYDLYNLKHPFMRAMVFTRMQKLYAHYVFPCFNRVEMKSKFKIKIGHLQNLNSFTNTKFVSRKTVDNKQEWIEHLGSHYFNMVLQSGVFVEKEETEGSDSIPNIFVVDEFAQTDLISTFSIALAVVDFSSYPEPETRQVGPPANPGGERIDIEIRVFAETDILNEYRVKEVQRIAAQSLAFFADFFYSNYDLGKLYMIVVRAKEVSVEDSYGLIYLGEKVVKSISTESSYYRTDSHLLVSRICQAMSTQWIGHYISLTSWNEDWFYEGLHTYLQRDCVLNIFPHWTIIVTPNSVDSFINLLRTGERGRDFDPIMHFGIDMIFTEKLNSETKLKIYLIIRMLAFILDFEKNLFQKSLANFIAEFKTAKKANLKEVFKTLTKTAKAVQGLEIMPIDMNVTTILMPWLTQKGHPLVKVTRNKAGNAITVTQTPFLFPDQNERERPCWVIPFDILTRDHVMSLKPRERKWLTCVSGPLIITITNLKKTDWIVLSSQLHVPGRVQYDSEMWKLIKEMFHSENDITNVDNLTRIQLIHDMFTLAEASYLDYDFVFEVIKYIHLENDYECWHVIHRELVRLRLSFSGTSLFEPYQEFVRKIVKPTFDSKISSINEFLKSEHSKDPMKRVIIKTACIFELADCKQYSTNILNNIMFASADYEKDNRISEFLKESFFCAAMKDADERIWDFMLKKYENKPDSRILKALGCSKNTRLLNKYLNWALSARNSKSSAELGLKVFEILSSSNEGYQLIANFFKTYGTTQRSNKDLLALHEFINRFKTKSHITIKDFVIKAQAGSKKKDDLKMLQEFFETIEDHTEEKITLEREVVKVANRFISWFELKAKDLSKYFSNPSNAVIKT